MAKVLKEKVTVTVADVKMNLLTADPEAVQRMATSLDARVTRLVKRAKCTKGEALVMLIMEQADSQAKSAELIHSQQEQIFALMSRNAALLGHAEESAPYGEVPESALLRENARLRQKNEELLDELLALRESR